MYKCFLLNYEEAYSNTNSKMTQSSILLQGKHYHKVLNQPLKPMLKRGSHNIFYKVVIKYSLTIYLNGTIPESKKVKIFLRYALVCQFIS